jgi:Holliday junction resolvasome RuvABC endonuclease subunit
MVFRLCRLPPRPLRADVTDALALAIAGLSQEGRAGALLAMPRRPNAALARLLREASR